MLALVTGVGAKGQVGETVARAMASRGDTVLVVARDEKDALERAAELTEDGLDAHGLACDLTDPTAVAALAQRIMEAHGDRLDALVNLAGGFGTSGSLATSDPAQVARMFSINFTTAYLATRAFLPLVRAAAGSIVYFASESVLENVRTSGVSGYAAAKSAVVALMRSVADETRADGVRANALAPGSIRTAANVAAMGTDVRYLEREQVAGVVAWLCSPAASSITGQVLRLRA